jgi:glucose-6-phosphate isomerase
MSRLYGRSAGAWRAAPGRPLREPVSTQADRLKGVTGDFEELTTRLTRARTASRLRTGDTTVFSGDPADAPVHARIGQRLGWVTAPDRIAAWADEAREFARDARQDGLTDLVLLGMGGSSLCAEVLRDAPGSATRAATLRVLDTTDERAVLEATRALVPERTLFLVASKSGSTIEVTSLEAYFRSILERARGSHAGRHFAAITDAATPLVAHAHAHGYRTVFLNPSDIGGRYSALSLFGLVPAAMIGRDLDDIARSARDMAEACRLDVPDNPGLRLGAFMAANARAGRDKLTLFLADEWRPLGVWIEQLVAESTGKDGVGVLPIVEEPPGTPAEYGRDRQFVVVGAANDLLARDLESLGHPTFRITPAGLGGEFYRWEFATAICGAALGVNPFDEPNVRDAKVRTQAQLDAFRAHGAFALTPPLTRQGALLVRQHVPAGQPREHAPYIAILDYLPHDTLDGTRIADLRLALRRRTGAATTYGVGPRYLHSTGQLHKGGPNAGTHVLLTASDATTTSIPGTDISFSTLKQAQALGDFEALVAADRRVVHLHLDDAGGDAAELVDAALRAADGRI